MIIEFIGPIGKVRGLPRECIEKGSVSGRRNELGRRKWRKLPERMGKSQLLFMN